MVENSFTIAQRQIRTCAKQLNLEDDIVDQLLEPVRELHVSIPVKMDNGKVKVFQGFRVQYNDALGPTKGGIRFHPGETIDTIKALAAWMTWKTALMDLPLGGGKGGIICNPKEMSQGEQERLCRGYVRAIGTFIGPEVDIPAPDVNTTGQHMAWMVDEYSKLHGKNEFGVITGKPLNVGGCLGREDATARGGMFALREDVDMDQYRDEPGLEGMTVAIQGFGNAGMYAAKIAKEEYGMKVIAVSDSKGGAISLDGLDIDEIIKHKKVTRSVVPVMEDHYPYGDYVSKHYGYISNNDLLTLNVDVLILAAMENQITAATNAGDIHAKIIVELANGPTTPDADDILYSKGIHVIPDILANAGGVVVSYLEMVQNFQHIKMDINSVHEILDRKITKAYVETYDISREKKINMRQAAYMTAVKRVAEAMRVRGV
jgi:glutamate dehydrogenase (NAD(P)+)